ncbi:hypothetical protein [Bacillus cereus group sp. BfR-BA-01495]|uniref:hypothetical protein n=1 Tax=Bacillus cereus group sp. BfR-BA-01495 TaxID=2920363 RepID=UPI001F5659E0|nr:hypothetical protein [Bacillus cereus group sp. BfR-BA-01495]
MDWNRFDVNKIINNETFFNKLYYGPIVDFGKIFDGERWSNLKRNEKKRQINEFFNFMCRRFELEEKSKPKLRFKILSSKSFGYYYNNKVTINRLKLGNGEEIAATIVHELAHAYQWRIITNVHEVSYEHSNYPMAKSEFEKRVERILANPAHHPVKEWYEDFQKDQNEMEFDEYINLRIEVFVFEKEVEYCHYMFGRMTNSQAEWYVGFKGKHNFGEMIVSDYGNGVLIKKDSELRLIGVETNEGYKYFVQYQDGKESELYASYTDAYNEYVKLK